MTGENDGMNRHPGYLLRALTLAVGLLLAGLVTTEPVWAETGFRFDAHLLKVVFVDVGHGDCIWIQTPARDAAGRSRRPRNILIDGGMARAGREVVVPLLRRAGVERIDLLLATHPHPDHIGGLTVVLDSLAVDTVWDVPLADDSEEYAAFSRHVRQDTTRLVDRPQAGQVVCWEPGIQLAVLAADSVPHEHLNDNSLVLRLTFGQISFLFPGDAEAVLEDSLVAGHQRRAWDLTSTVLKVPHHGSNTSSSPAFLAAVAPEYAIISTGNENFSILKKPDQLLLVNDTQTPQQIEVRRGKEKQKALLESNDALKIVDQDPSWRLLEEVVVKRLKALGIRVFRTDEGDQAKAVGQTSGDDHVLVLTDGKTCMVTYWNP